MTTGQLAVLLQRCLEAVSQARVSARQETNDLAALSNDLRKAITEFAAISPSAFKEEPRKEINIPQPQSVQPC